MKIFIIILVSIFLLSGCEVNGVTTHPALKIDSYELPLKGSVEDRVVEPTDIILDYLIKYDQVNEGFYKPYYPSEEEMVIIRDFVENFMGAGMVDWFFDKNSNPYTWIVFNPDLFNHSVSSWLSYRDSSCFIEKRGYEIIYDAGETNAFTYMLFHEMMHVIDISKKITPYKQHFYSGDTNKGIHSNNFTRGVWSDFQELDETIDFPMKNQLTFYGLGGSAAIDISESPDVYELVEHSPFTSLYSLVNFMEDFAEFGAIYLHSKVHGRPFSVFVKRDGEVIYSFENPLDRENVKERLVFVKNALES